MGGKQRFKLDRLSQVYGMGFGMAMTSLLWMMTNGEETYVLLSLIPGCVMGILAGIAIHNRDVSEQK
ncbi:MAG: hypothetical protein IT365_26910 [Candidatus Hydrogenedentes bacterium]|nr:hypothetical protein [Candidatus Hydrogenedentota bacterium]